MIYPYTTFVHPVQKFHAGLCYFFNKLFELEPSTFDKSVLFEPTFLPLITSSRVRLEEPLNAIWKAYMELASQTEKDKVRDAFINNNRLEELCKGALIPYKFDELHEDVRIPLNDFWKEVWDDFSAKGSITKLVSSTCGEVLDHFHEFKRQPLQESRVCPFCGINGLHPPDDIYRSCYDHYLPKTLYPFTSVNFDNVVPICHECNSLEKKTKDILFEGTVRRKVFYPFDKSIDSEKLELKIESQTPCNLNSTLLKNLIWEHSMKIEGRFDERLISWDAIFRIKDRFHKYSIGFEKVWFDHLTKVYHREIKKGTSFEDIKQEILSDAKDGILTSNMGILKFSYYHFLLVQNDIEQELIEFTQSKIV